MKCPHCAAHFHHEPCVQHFNYKGSNLEWQYILSCCASCNKWIIWIRPTRNDPAPRQVEPIGSTRGPVPPEVPADIATDYSEACLVLPYSPKASAALSRRCLQYMLRQQGYQSRDLAKQIDDLLNETDARKAIPASLRETIDTIRNFGNFSAHPITDVTTLQIVDVESHEAEWCLETIEEAFQHFYVRPAHALARKAALNQKLIGAGKPPAK